MTDEQMDELALRYTGMLFTGGGLRAFGRAVAAAERERLHAMIADDATASTYQTMGQYRAALLLALRTYAI
jgi:hypothetical protein